MLLSEKKELFKKVTEEIRNDNSKCNCLIIISSIAAIYPFFFFIQAIFTCINSENYLLFIASSIHTIFTILSMIALRGKLYCCCLYNPYQWFFFMVVINTIIIIFDLIMPILIGTNKNIDYDTHALGPMGFMFHLFFVGSLFAYEGKIYSKLKIIFNEIRLFETNLAKYCVLEYIKELKSEIND